MPINYFTYLSKEKLWSQLVDKTIKNLVVYDFPKISVLPINNQ